jgi:hypothetical protein
MTQLKLFTLVGVANLLLEVSPELLYSSSAPTVVFGRWFHSRAVLWKEFLIQHHLVDTDRDLYLRPGDSRTRGQHRFFQERSNYDTLRNSFQRTAREWNHLPNTTVGAELE